MPSVQNSLPTKEAVCFCAVKCSRAPRVCSPNRWQVPPAGAHQPGTLKETTCKTLTPADLVQIDSQPMTTSRKVAARFGKTPSVVNRSIKALLKTVPDEFGRLNFQITQYRDAKGEMRTEFLMTDHGASVLAARMKQPWGASFAEAPPAVRPEFVFGEEVVERLFSGYTIIRQFPVFGGKYRIDWYIPELRLAVEFDEAHHETPSIIKRDAARQAEIEAALNCRFLRYKAE